MRELIKEETDMNEIVSTDYRGHRVMIARWLVVTAYHCRGGEVALPSTTEDRS